MRPRYDLLIRSFYYFRSGYGVYLSLPISLIGYTTTIYYLMLQNIPFLKKIFPGFIEFAVTAFLILYPLGALIGWVHYKKAPLYKTEAAIQVESNPYSQNKLAPVMIPMWELYYEWGTREKIDQRILGKIKTIIEASK